MMRWPDDILNVSARTIRMLPHFRGRGQLKEKHGEGKHGQQRMSWRLAIIHAAPAGEIG
jgi:hypothetical protein